MSNKIHKYLSKLSLEPITTEKFGIYLRKLNQWYDQYGGGKGECDEYTDEKKCNKSTNKNKEQCAWKLLDAEGFSLENRPPEKRCVTQTYKQRSAFCSPLKSKELCENSQSFSDLPKKSKQVGRKTEYVDDITDCVWVDDRNTCGYIRK